MHSYISNDYTSDEKRLHKIFNSKQIKSEWFKLDYDDIKYIKSL